MLRITFPYPPVSEDFFNFLNILGINCFLSIIKLGLYLHLQQRITGERRRMRGEATTNRTPNMAKMPTTWALCRMTELLECPNFPLQAPES